MNVTCPAAVPIPCSSFSPCSFVARHSCSANVGLRCSPLRRSSSSSSGGCALSFSATRFNSNFFQLSYRRRKHNSSSEKVRARSSTFDPVEERDGDGIQPAGAVQKRSVREREEPASSTRVPWSADSKARVPWTPQKQQDRASWSPEKQQTRDFRSSSNNHARSGPSPRQYKDSYSLNNQQQAFLSSQTLPSSSDFSRKQQVRVIDSTTASRLQNRLPAFKQAAEPDAFGASFFSIDGADACSSFSPSNTQKIQGYSPEKGGPRNGSVFTSQLEEILNKFRARESGFKGNSSRDDPYEDRRRNVAAPSTLQGETVTDNGFQASVWKKPDQPISGSSTGVKTGSPGSIKKGQIASWHSRSRPRESGFKGKSSRDDPYEERGRNVAAPSTLQSETVTDNGFKASLREKADQTISGSSTGIKTGSPGSIKKSQTARWHSQSRLGESGFKGNSSRDDPYEERRRNVAAPSTLQSETVLDDGFQASLREKADQRTSGSSMGVKTGSLGYIKEGEIASWHSHSRPDLSFEFQYSYSENPAARVMGYREEPYSPFGPDTMGRPWTGGPPLKKSKKNLPMFDSFNPPPKGKKGIKFVQDPGPYREGQGPKPARSREEVLGEPLTGEEIVQLVDLCQNENRLLNLGRDGLTHNMLDLIHSHWKRRRVIKIRCIGVPTVDMDNVCFHLEDKTGGKIVYRTGGIVYLFRGRNYNYKDRPVIPLMLWKPPAPVYPKLIKKAPGGLTKEDAYKLRLLGRKVEPLCTLGKNGVYLSLVKDVRAAFKVDELVRVDCRGLNPSDYKKIGAKLRDLVPCVLLSFDDEQILMWKGKASVSADVDNSNRMEAAECSEFEAAEPSASCAVESAGLNMVDTKTKVLADVAMADGADVEPCSTVQDINQQSLVVDTIGASMESSECSISAYGAEGWSDNASSGNSEIFNSHTGASLSGVANDESKSLSSINDGISASSGSSHASTVTGTTNQISSTKLAKNDACLEESREQGLTARSEVNSSTQTVLAVEDDMIFDKADLIPEYSIPESEKDSADYMAGYKQESNAASDIQFEELRQFLESNIMEEDKEDDVMVVPQASMMLEQPSAKLDNSSRDAETGKKGPNYTHVIVRVDALWDQAIASGIALLLDDLDTDNDAIVKKASELAKTVPAGCEYTKGLLSKLRVRKENVPVPDDDLRIHFRNLQKLKTQKKLSKRPFRLPRVDVPEKGGLPIEELARLLSIK